MSARKEHGFMSKQLDDYFSDWEGSVFGYGYGTGEEHVLSALRSFMRATGDGDRPDSYDYRKIEAACGATVAWLLINALCRAHIIEYGSSPRFGWLADEGKRLRDFVCSHSTEQLVELSNRDVSHDYLPCYPDACNCGPEGHQEGVKCPNPFWPNRRL